MTRDTDPSKTETLDARPTAADPESAGTDGNVDVPDGERYRVLGRIGKGGMGEVMLVRDRRINREVALKRIRQSTPSERTRQRFLREASVQGRLEHPAIVPLYDLDHDDDGRPFFTMRKLAGTTLTKLLVDRHDRVLQRLLRAFAEVCLAIELAHTRGIIHRDLKPDNIVLGDFGEVYVLDWGVAKIVGEPDSELGELTDSSDDTSTATIPGTALGTPGYMAPEQVRGDADLDARADVYALGCILFEILAHVRRHPSGKAGLASALDGSDVRPSERARDRTIPPELDELCLQATATDRAHRIATARELGERVQRYLDGDRDLATRRQLARAHLERAQAAFAAGDDEDHRRIAVREAASALALDPTLASAAELVGRLMLEPPRITPREVEEAIVEDDVQTMQSHARVGVRIYVGFLVFTPLLWWIAPRGSPYVLALSALIASNLTLCWLGARIRPLGKEGLFAVSNMILLAIVAHTFSPFLVAPGMAATSALVIVLTPTRSRLTSAISMTALACLAVLGPWVLERIGTLPMTTMIGEHGITLRAPGLAGDETSTLIVAVLYVVGLIVGASGLASAMRTRELAARRHLHLQAWQLRQLVPR
jgi:serine/threonine-protein kinase